MVEVRIQLAQMSPLLTRMITDLLAPEEGIEIVGCTNGAEDSLVVARAKGANMIITQESVQEPSLGAIVDELPLTILAIAPSGSTSTSINFSRRTLRLHGEDGNALAHVVRKAMELA